MCRHRHSLRCNFTSGTIITDCTSYPIVQECLVGDFAVIFGAWANYHIDDYDAPEPGAGYTLNTVDCRVSYGTSTIVQTGNSTPYIQHGSFAISTTSLEAKDDDSSARSWQGMYSSHMSPFRFASEGDSGVSVGELTAYLIQSEPRTTELPPFTNDTNRVARALERCFDTATLLAFVRAPDASTIKITNSPEIATWTYDVKVLAILAAPLLATLFVLSRYWQVRSNYIVIGYDPLKIARRANDILEPTIPSGQGHDVKDGFLASTHR
jgi:hypothetical protein